MALILKEAVRLYYYLNEEVAHSRTQDWPLMRTPWPGFAILVLYLFVVLKWLPKFMENRPAYNIRKVLLVYNLSQIGLCAYVTYQSLRLGWLNHYSLLCQEIDNGPGGDEFAWKVCYIYFLTKLADLLDTVFFVLTKKQNHVSFLHVYHHFGMGCVSWGMVKWVPGGHGSIIVPVNSFVHIVMYSYYMLTTWSESKKGFWWKKYVTQLQILQFGVLLVHMCTALVVKDCTYPIPPVFLIIPQNLFMFILFSDFYYRSYIKKSTAVKNK